SEVAELVSELFSCSGRLGGASRALSGVWLRDGRLLGEGRQSLRLAGDGLLICASQEHFRVLVVDPELRSRTPPEHFDSRSLCRLLVLACGGLRLLQVRELRLF